MEQPTDFFSGAEVWISVASPEELEAQGLVEGDDATYMMESMESDVYTAENLIMTFGCVETFFEEDIASILISTSMTLIAMTLLN